MKIVIDKVRANERESSLFELFQRAQPKLNNAVVNWDLLLKPNEIKEKATGQKRPVAFINASLKARQGIV